MDPRTRPAPAAPVASPARAPSAPRLLGRRREPPAPRGAAKPEPALPALSRIPLGFRIADAYLALALFLTLELFAVAFVRRREIIGPFEVARAAMSLLPIAWTLAAPLAVVGGALVELVLASDRPRPRLALAVVGAAGGGAVGLAVSGGRLLASGARRPAFVLLVAAVAAALAASFGPPLARWLRMPPGARRVPVPLAVGAALALLEVVNATVLPRLYPGFHAGLSGLALLVAPFLAIDWLGGGSEAPTSERATAGKRPPGRARLARAGAALVLLAASAALSPFAAKRLVPADNVRVIYATHAPLLAHAVTLASSMEPPAPLEGDALPAEVTVATGSIDLSGLDLVLVTVDALRADHVGAYGYARAKTPAMDALAAEGALFERAYTATPHTSYALTSLMTGKYMRPLVLQDLGADSETFAHHLRRYGYKTAAFYPPAIFFIDGGRFASFKERGLDFEYARVEFMSARGRVGQVDDYLKTVPPTQRVFLWVHLFEPHEPYEDHPGRSFGDRDKDRYDSEIAEADAAIGDIVRVVRAARPNAAFVVSADHGEEFLDHGGRYHGTTVYEEQVRVPLIVSAPGRIEPRRIEPPVQLVDVLPTVLSGLDVPKPARVRGRDLGPLLAGSEPPPELASGFAFAETETQTLLAKGPLRLVCERRIGACALYDIERDPGQRFDLSETRGAELATLRTELRALEASHGRFEVRGLRKEGKGYPEALRRGISGDGDAAGDVAALLDDADVGIRRKAAEVLFELRRTESAPFLRLALVRDEDEEVKRWAALALTRLGEGASRARELVQGGDLRFRRLAALALAETGDDRGEDVLVAWFRSAYARDVGKKHRETIPFERAVELVDALGKIKAKDALVPMLDALDDVRLRPHLARALASLGEDAARPALADRLASEPHETARVAIAEALVKLGAGPEMRAPLIRLLGAPDPLPNGVRIAETAEILDLLGGPSKKSDLSRLRRFATSGIAVGLVVPKPPKGEPDLGVRVLCRARSTDDLAGEIRVGRRSPGSLFKVKRDKGSLVPASSPELDPKRSIGLLVPRGREPTEVFDTLPETLGIDPGDYVDLVVYATQNVELHACLVVPKTRPLPPPPPEPWTPSQKGETGDGAALHEAPDSEGRN